MNMDFLGFTFNGKHSYLDLGVLRTINDRMQHSLSPDMNDITADNPGGEGMYYFGSYHKSKKFQIDFAFDHLNEQQMRAWKKFCSNKELSDLIFDEEPYKVYTAKITGAPILKTIPFDEDGERIYKGEGTLEFTAYWPYAHTPDENTKVSEKFIVGGKFGADGKLLDNYSELLYPTKSQWSPASGITTHTPGSNPGDMPAPFVFKAPESITDKSYLKELVFKVGDLSITVPAASSSETEGLITYTHHSKIEWDSKTGIVSAEINGKRQPIVCSGDSLGGIPVGGISVDGWGIRAGDGTTANPYQYNHTNCSLTYHYWYY